MYKKFYSHTHILSKKKWITAIIPKYDLFYVITIGNAISTAGFIHILCHYKNPRHSLMQQLSTHKLS